MNVEQQSRAKAACTLGTGADVFWLHAVVLTAGRHRFCVVESASVRHLVGKLGFSISNLGRYPHNLYFGDPAEMGVAKAFCDKNVDAADCVLRLEIKALFATFLVRRMLFSSGPTVHLINLS